jgi:YihY family inner membrane protein
MSKRGNHTRGLRDFIQKGCGGLGLLFRRPGIQEVDEALLQARGRYSLRVWWLLLRETIFQARTHDLGTKSGSLTYSTILSCGPLLASAFFFFQQFGGLDKLIDETLVPLISSYFSEDVGDQLQGYLKLFVLNFKPAVLGSVAIATFLVTVVGLLGGIEKAFNSICAAPFKRPLWRQVLNYWTLLTITPFVITLSTSQLSRIFSNTIWLQSAWNHVSWLVYILSFGALAFGFSLLFYFLPNRSLPFKALFWGGLLTALMFRILQIINIFLTSNILENSTATALYGTAPLIAVALFFWLRLVWIVVLFGACFVVSIANFEEHLRSEETFVTPVDGLLNCAAVFAAVCEDYRSSGDGMDVLRLANVSGVSHFAVIHWLDWLRKRRVVFASAANGVERHFPTHLGLSMEQNPEIFVEKVLFSRLEDSDGNLNSCEGFLAQTTEIIKTRIRKAPHIDS